MRSIVAKWLWAGGLALLVSAHPTGPARGEPASEAADPHGFVWYMTGQQNCQACHAANLTLAWQDAEPKRIRGLLADQVRVEQPFLAVFREPADAALGATLEPVSEALRAQLGIPDGQGLVVVSLAGDGPAAEAGLKQNDILLNVADKPVASPEDLPKQLKAAGEAPVLLHLVRSGKPVSVQVRPVYRVTLGPVGEKKTDYYIGVGVAHPDDTLRAHVELPAGVGLVATEIVPNSPAAKVGVKVHDILLEMDGKSLDSPETLVAQVQAANNKATPLKLLRAGKPLTLSITPELRAVETPKPHESLRLWSVEDYHNPHMNLRWYAPLWQKNVPATPGNDPVDTRLDRLDRQLRELRQSVDELRDSLKAGKLQGRD
jgi:serine protease Do